MKSIAAGLCIGLGCDVFLAVENPYIRVLMFCMALTFICLKGYNLYTGKAGYLGSKEVSFFKLGFILLGNILGLGLNALVLKIARPDLTAAATSLMESKLVNSDWQWLWRSYFCGILMYYAVSLYKEHKSIVPILFGVSAFLLCGFEHSIANIGYLLISGPTWKGLGFAAVCVIGNLIGSLNARALD